MEVTKAFEKYLGKSQADKRALEAERLIVGVTERILAEMRKQDLSKAELARRLGKSKSFVSATLDGSRNLTLRTLANIAFALGLKVEFKLNKASSDEKHPAKVYFFAAHQPSDDYHTSVGRSSSVALEVAR